MRKKLEGKPVTKKEREIEARRLAHLAVLQEQGARVIVESSKHPSLSIS